MQPKTLIAELRARAEGLGFDAFGVTRADARPDLPEKLAAAIERGWHGDMEWIPETAERRGSPAKLWDRAKSVVMLGVNYGPDSDQMAQLEQKTVGNISVYARNRDYHELIKGACRAAVAAGECGGEGVR
jgi:epoxyqueuosine reductase